MGDLDGALHAYEQALRHNFQSIQAMNAISCILRTKENFPRAVEYLQGILKLDASNGEVWGSLGQFQAQRLIPPFPTKTLLRTLLSHDGGSTAGVCSVSTSSVPSTRPQGDSYSQSL